MYESFNMADCSPVLLLGAGGMLWRAWDQLLESRGVERCSPGLDQLDLTRPLTIEQQVTPRFKIVINCAGWTDVDGAETDASLAMAINGEGVGALARRCAATGALLIHYSTDYVFNGRATVPWRTDHPIDPLNVYGQTKARGEELLRQAGCPYLLVRTSWMYAPWGRNFVRTMAHRARRGLPMVVVDDQRGRPTSAEHLASTSVRLVERGARGIYHVTDDGECSWYEFTLEIVNHVNPPGPRGTLLQRPLPTPGPAAGLQRSGPVSNQGPLGPHAPLADKSRPSPGPIGTGGIDPMSRHILLTGGCGFIGSNFVRFVLEHRPDWRITNLDCLSYSGNPENLADLESDAHYRFVHGNICDAALVDRLLAECDDVVHMAAESHVDRSILDSRPFVESNVLGTQTLLDAVRRGSTFNPKAGITAPGNDRFRGRFVHVSTDEVYGSLPLDQPQLKFTESTPLTANSPYSASKAGSDLLATAYHHTFGLDICITRCSNNFGPYQFPEKVIPLFVTNLIEGHKVPLYGDGRNVRDWLHVTDHCEAIVAVLEKGRAGEVYNIGGNNERSNLELTHAILAIMGKGPEMIQPVTDRLGHDRRYAIDASKIRRELGWEPTRSAWPAALEATVRWYVDQPQWWQRVKSGAYREYYEKQYGGR